MIHLTEEMKKAYLESGGNYCPVCRSEDIEATGGFDFEGGYVYENIVCNNCNSEWTDEYTLTGLLLLDE
jgi:transposase-like protein